MTRNCEDNRVSVQGRRWWHSPELFAGCQTFVWANISTARLPVESSGCRGGPPDLGGTRLECQRPSCENLRHRGEKIKPRQMVLTGSLMWARPWSLALWTWVPHRGSSSVSGIEGSKNKTFYQCLLWSKARLRDQTNNYVLAICMNYSRKKKKLVSKPGTLQIFILYL